MKRVLRNLLWILFAAVSISTVSCEGGSAVSKKTITYKCLSSSCDATVACDEGAPVPEHCGKPMIH